jgi:hypothetical protein
MTISFFVPWIPIKLFYKYLKKEDNETTLELVEDPIEESRSIEESKQEDSI